MANGEHARKCGGETTRGLAGKSSDFVGAFPSDREKPSLGRVEGGHSTVEAVLAIARDREEVNAHLAREYARRVISHRHLLSITWITNIKWCS